MGDEKQDPEQEKMKQAASAYGKTQRSGLERSSSVENAGKRARLIADAMATYRTKRTVLDELDARSRRRLEALAAKVFSTERED